MLFLYCIKVRTLNTKVKIRKNITEWEKIIKFRSHVQCAILNCKMLGVLRNLNFFFLKQNTRREIGKGPNEEGQWKIMWTEFFVHEKLKWKTILFLFCSCFLMASAGASPLFSFNEAVQMSLVPMPLNSNTCSFLLLWFILHFAGSTKVFWLCAKGLWGAMTAKRLKRFQSGQSRDKSQIC